MKNDLRLSYSYGLYLVMLMTEIANLVKCFPQPNNHFLHEQNKLAIMGTKQDDGNIFDKDRAMDIALRYKYLLDERNSPLDIKVNLNREYDPFEERELEEYQRTQKRDDNQVQRGWGAGGLPFNALYMSNSFKPVSTRSQQIYALPLSSQVQPARAETVPAPAPHTQELKIYKPPVQQESKQKGSTRRFLTLPHLFLSYPWDSNRV